MHTILDNWIYYSIDNKEEQKKKNKKKFKKVLTIKSD